MRNALFVFLFSPLVLLAQTVTNAAGEVAREAGIPTGSGPSVEELTARLDLRQVIENGGWLIYLLVAMSVVGAALVVYFLFALRGGQIAPAAFVRELQLTFKTGNLDEVKELCAKNRSPVSALARSAVHYLERAEEDADPDLLRQVVEGEGVRQVGRLQAQVTYLMDIGVIAPMVGLLGTVMGMLRSFSSVALDIAKVKPMVLADGVSQALITTAAGLVVAIPAMIFYSVFRGRLAKLTANLELIAADLVTSLVHRKPQ
jgi:biopolymer transport protein ExbB